MLVPSGLVVVPELSVFPLIEKSDPPACNVSSMVEVSPAVIAPSATIVAIPIPIPIIARIALLLFLKGFLKINDINDINNN
ncbi:hypothetical protein MARBORIA2_04510 [Methanobrevibacter arboriphilus]|nr:hypothetical protein MARBORIA2_04510 [Methanobrevibacter arboriphilus]